jgi:hypothetical protein
MRRTLSWASVESRSEFAVKGEAEGNRHRYLLDWFASPVVVPADLAIST